MSTKRSLNRYLLFIIMVTGAGCAKEKKRDAALRMNNEACVLAQAGKYAQAKKYWQLLITNRQYVTPEVAYVNLSKLAVEEGDFVGAERLLAQAMYLCPNYVDACFYRALVACQLHEYEKARVLLASVQSLAPTHTGARELRARLY